MLGTQAVPGTVVALVRVVALLIPWDYQGVIHPIKKSLLQQRKSLCLCTDISLPLYQRNPQIKVASRAFLNTAQSGVSRFLATNTIKKMNHRSYYRLNFHGVLLTAGSKFHIPMVTLPQNWLKRLTDSSLRS